MHERLNRHQKGWVPATKGRLPVVLKVFTTFSDKYLAFEFEKYLKSGSDRAFCIRHFISK
jgi:predicted GIY-YIG superfamily endonuclease